MNSFQPKISHFLIKKKKSHDIFFYYRSLAIRNFELMIKSLDQRSFQVVIEAFQSCDLEANAEIDGIVKYFLTAAEAKEKVKSSMFLQLAQKFHEKDKSGKFKKNLVLKLLHEVTEILTQAVNSTKDDQKFLAKIELFCDFHGIGWIENVEIVNFVDKLSFEFVQSDSQVEIFHCLITKIPIELIANCKNLSDLKTKLENVSENEISCKIYLLVIEVLKILENILSKSGEVL